MSSLNLRLFSSLNRSTQSFGRPFSGPTQDDSLALQSDVTVFTNRTLYAEYKGFFIYVLSGVVLFVYVCWALFPDSILQDQLGLYYYPDRYWSKAVPSWILMAMLFTYLMLALYNTEVLTPPIGCITNFVDEYAYLVGSEEATDELRLSKTLEYIDKAPSGVWDLPILVVNEVLYSDERI